jgi:hypothetical protein
MGLGPLVFQSGTIYNDWSQIDLLPINARTTWFCRVLDFLDL